MEENAKMAKGDKESGKPEIRKKAKDEAKERKGDKRFGE